MECEFCKTTFSSISSLNKHKVKTKYCLKLQGIDTNSIVCEYCNECFSSMKTIDKHMKKCAIIKLTKDNETLKKQIQEQLLKLKENQDEIQSLKDQLYKKDIEIAELKSANNIYKDSQECLKEIAKQPKTTTTTTNNNKNYMNMPVFNLTKESIENMVKKNFTFDHLQDGQTGVACFTVDNLLKDKDNNLLYECSDPSRNMFVYKTQKGIEKDFKANKLTKLVFDDVMKKAASLSDDTLETNIKLCEIQQMKKDNSKFTNKLSNLLYKNGEIEVTNELINDNSNIVYSDSENEYIFEAE